MNFFKTCTFLIFFIFFLQSSNGQVNNIGLPSIKNFKKNEYKGGTQNWDVDQDKKGNVYFANNNGLLQFDGLFWRLYNINNSINVRSVKVDNVSGRIYVGGYNEFGYFKSDASGELIYTSLNGLIKNSKNSLPDYIWKIHIINDSIIFQAFFGLYIYKDGEINLVEPRDRFQFSFTVKNKLYIQDVTEGIFTLKDGKLLPLEGSKILNNTEVWGIFPVGGDKLLFATLEKGLFIQKNNRIQPWETKANTFIKKNGSLGGSFVSQNKLILNSVLDGIIIVDFEGNISQHIDTKKGLQNNTILKSFIDNKNNLWLGLDNGISFVNINSPFTFFDAAFDLSTVYASVIHKGIIYAATNQGVFCHDLSSPFLDDVFSLIKGTTGQSWNIQVFNDELICANNNGAFIIRENKLHKTLDTEGYFGFKEIPSNTNYLIGANYGGFSLFKKEKTGLEFKGVIHGAYSSSNFFEIDNNYLWVKKNQFLHRMTLSKDFKNFTNVKTYEKLQPSENNFNSLQAISNKIYFESKNHFYTYSKENDLFIEDKKLTGLFVDRKPVSYVKEDVYKNLWYVSNESLGVFLKTGSEKYKNLETVFSNLTGDLVENFVSINPIDKHNVFIGSTNGLVKFNSESLNTVSHKPKAYIRSFTYSKDTIIQGNPQSVNSEITLPYKANNVKFTFSSPEFSNTNKVLFSYQLNPFDNDWSNWDKTSLKEYTNLREGNYTMKLKVKNSFGKQSEIECFQFVISPPWYRHYFAYLFYLLFIALSIYFVSMIVKLRYRKKEYYKTVEQRKVYLEKESKIKQEQYQLEREIEKLNRENLQTRLLSKDKELVNNSLQVAKKNKILNGIIQKLKSMDTDSLNESTRNQFIALKKSITKEIKSDNNWKELEKHIKNVHFDFLKRVKEKHPSITSRELDLSTYLLINMSTKEIAEVMNISSKGVELARYRLRKKIGLKRKQSLSGYLMNI